MPEHAGLLALLSALSLMAVAAPHLVSLERIAPRAALGVWLAALALRAVLAMVVAAAAFIWIPHYSGAAPALWIVASASVFATVLGVVSVQLRRTLRERGLGVGPSGSLVIADRAVYVALTGVGRPRVLVSAAALDRLDEGELAASIAHEHGHQRLGHRTLSLAGAGLHALARPFVGGAACRRGLRLGLERQADEWAVRETGDGLALASAICKAAPSGAPAGGLGVASAPTTLRVAQLMEGVPARSGRVAERAALALACGLTLLTGALGVTLWATLSTHA